MNTYNVVISVSITVCIDAENHDDAIEKVSQALNSGDANMSADVASSICCPFFGKRRSSSEKAESITKFKLT